MCVLLFLALADFQIDFIYASGSVDIAFSALACRITTKCPRNHCGGKMCHFKFVNVSLYLFFVCLFCEAIN